MELKTKIGHVLGLILNLMLVPDIKKIKVTGNISPQTFRKTVEYCQDPTGLMNETRGKQLLPRFVSSLLIFRVSLSTFLYFST